MNILQLLLNIRYMNTDNKISRRDALKRMGAAVISSTVASSGLLSLTSCGGKTNKRLIFYFTGTGNCLYIARQLAGADTELLSIPQMVKQGKYEFEADEIGIVYPIYGHMPPYMVRQFIQQVQLRAGYKFAVLTYGARKRCRGDLGPHLPKGRQCVRLHRNHRHGGQLAAQLRHERTDQNGQAHPRKFAKITADINGQRLA